MKLDAKSIAALKLDGRRDVIHFDDALPGFGYRLRQGAGGKINASWVAQYRRAGGTRRVLLGAGSVLTAEQARKRAREVLAQATLGHDPQGEKAERRAKDKLTLLGVVSEYLAGKEQQLRPKSLRETTRYLTDAGYFGPLHRLPINSVTRKDVAALLVQIARTRGATTSSLARSALSAFYTWCMQAGMAETNPVIGVLRVNSHPRDRVLSDAELAKIWKATAHSGDLSARLSAY